MKLSLVTAIKVEVAKNLIVLTKVATCNDKIFDTTCTCTNASSFEVTLLPVFHRFPFYPTLPYPNDLLVHFLYLLSGFLTNLFINTVWFAHEDDQEVKDENAEIAIERNNGAMQSFYCRAVDLALVQKVSTLHCTVHSQTKVHKTSFTSWLVHVCIF